MIARPGRPPVSVWQRPRLDMLEVRRPDPNGGRTTRHRLVLVLDDARVAVNDEVMLLDGPFVSVPHMTLQPFCQPSCVSISVRIRSV